jgi:hypothetical protein
VWRDSTPGFSRHCVLIIEYAVHMRILAPLHERP